MIAFSEDSARDVIEAFLSNLRQAVTQRSLSKARLPGWLRAAKVRIGWVNYSLVAVFEDATQADIYEIRGPVGADMVVLLNTGNFAPSGVCFKARPGEGFIMLLGQYGESSRVPLHLGGERLALFDCGYAGYHGPRALFNLFLQHSLVGAEADPVATRFVPFALYIHQRDATDPARVWHLCEQHLTDLLVAIHNSEVGDFYERLQSRVTTLALNKRTSVIVLGRDSGPELEELIGVRDYLRARGYDAGLIKDFAEIPMMSNEEKVRAWTISSRFCVMVDRIPAGHIAEYMMLRGQRSILAILRPLGSRSTYMIGDDQLVDVNFIRVFEFDQTPLSVLADAIDWAEKIALERARAYDKAYPWRLAGPS